MTLQQEIDDFNKSYPNGALYQQISTVLSSRNPDYALGLLVILFDTAIYPEAQDKKIQKTRKEQRKKLQKFFKEDKSIISLDKQTFITTLPDQLAALIKASCTPPGHTLKFSAANELYSIVTLVAGEPGINRDRLQRLAHLKQTLKPALGYQLLAADLGFCQHRLKTILPYPGIGWTVEVPGSEKYEPDASLFSIEELMMFKEVWTHYREMDKKNFALVDLGLVVLDRLRQESVFPLRLAMLSAVLETIIQTPEAQMEWYFTRLCRDLYQKISPVQGGVSPDFEQFHQLRLNQVPGGTASPMDWTLKGSERERKLLQAMEGFLRLLVFRMINDPLFLKGTLPKMRVALKREVKKMKIKEAWWRFPGKYLSRLTRR